MLAHNGSSVTLGFGRGVSMAVPSSRARSVQANGRQTPFRSALECTARLLRAELKNIAGTLMT